MPQLPDCFDVVVCDHPSHPDRYKDTGYWRHEGKLFLVHLPEGEPEETTLEDFEFWNEGALK